MSLPRRFIIFALCVILSFSLGGCALPELFPNSETPESSPAPDADRYRADFADRFAYTRLEDRLQACYGSVYTALTDRFAEDEPITFKDENGSPMLYNGITVHLPYPLKSKDEAKILYNALCDDNPQLFYLGTIFSLEGYADNTENHYTAIRFSYTMDSEQRTAARAALEQAISGYIAGTETLTDEYEKELTLHDRLLADCDYDDTVGAGQTARTSRYTAYGALVEHKAVCEGYSRGIQLLFQRVGIECTVVTGASRENGESHMWNCVKVDGSYYHLDATWDDSADYVRHNYFNMTTRQAEITHIIDDTQSDIPLCTASLDDYFIRNGTDLQRFDREETAKILAQHIINGEKIVQFRFADTQVEAALVFFKNSALTWQTVDGHLAGHGLSLGSYALQHENDEGILTIIQK